MVGSGAGARGESARELEDEEVRAALRAAYGQVTACVAGFSAEDWLRWSRCAGWTTADLTLHLVFDAQRALAALTTDEPGSADTDFVSYWRAFTPSTDVHAARAHARFVRASAAAFSDPAVIGALWWETAAAAVRAADATPANRRVSTQRHVLAVSDFLATLVVEAAVHYLDLTGHLPAAPASDPRPLALARRTLEGLLAVPLPAHWDDEAAVLKGTGRVELSADDRAQLGAAADRFPLLG